MFTGVWLRHQEIEANKIRVFAQGFSDTVTGTTKGTADAFMAVLEGMFPFLSKVKDADNKQMIEKMKKEVATGKLYFSPAFTGPMKKAINKVVVLDDFKKKLEGKIKKRL